jgi:hypothetical protein
MTNQPTFIKQVIPNAAYTIEGKQYLTKRESNCTDCYFVFDNLICPDCKLSHLACVNIKEGSSVFVRARESFKGRRAIRSDFVPGRKLYVVYGHMYSKHIEAITIKSEVYAINTDDRINPHKLTKVDYSLSTGYKGYTASLHLSDFGVIPYEGQSKIWNRNRIFTTKRAAQAYISNYPHWATKHDKREEG